MKKIVTVLVVINLMFVLLCGCNVINNSSSDFSINSYTQINISESNDTIYDVIKPDIEANSFFEYRVDFNNNIYFINNKQENNISKILSLFDKHIATKTDNFDFKNESFYIVFGDINNTLTIQINQKDQIYLNHEHVYFSDGIYNDVMQYLSPILKENSKYYSLIYNEGKFTYSYEIYDINGNIIESDTVTKEPNISLCQNNIVWYWSQGGTGTLTRGAYFYDTKTDEKSPVYCGITDCYENLVLNSESKSVIISDMFSGTVIQNIDKFGMELYDSIETILDARFVENGTKVSVTYLAKDFSKQTEIFRLKTSNEDISEWKTTYLDFLKDKNGEYISFSLVYIDDDEIPELYMNGVCEATGDSVCSYKNGKIIQEHLNRTGGGRYIEKQGYICNENGNTGYYYTHVYELTENGFVNTFTALSAEHIKNIENDEYEITHEYSVKDVPVTEREYNAAVNDAFDFDKSIKLNENTVKYNDIIQQILNFK